MQQSDYSPKQREHITHILASLHRLPVHFRIHFKILLLWIPTHLHFRFSSTLYVPSLVLNSNCGVASWAFG